MAADRILIWLPVRLVRLSSSLNMAFPRGASSCFERRASRLCTACKRGYSATADNGKCVLCTASAADLKSLTDARENRVQALQKTGTRIIDLLMPMAFRSPRKGVAAMERGLRKVGTSHRKRIAVAHGRGEVSANPPTDLLGFCVRLIVCDERDLRTNAMEERRKHQRIE